MRLVVAPELSIAHWLNTPTPLSLSALRGKVVLCVAFQMLCPGCVSHGLPQAQRARAAFSGDHLAVIGLHSVFEHQDVQGPPRALAAFLHEYRIDFPVGVDASSGPGVPRTMRAHGMQGTPTTILVDRAGQLRLHKFGHLDDMRLGAAIQALIGEAALPAVETTPTPAVGCTDDACAAPISA